VPLSPGLHGSAKLVVTDEDTAVALRSGEVPVLGTPRLIALVEEAAVTAVHCRRADGVHLNRHVVSGRLVDDRFEHFQFLHTRSRLRRQ
jgi:hypothetical protein